MLSPFDSGILKTDGNLVITEADPSALAVFGGEGARLINRAFEDLVAPHDSKGINLFHKRLSMYEGSAVDVYPIHLVIKEQPHLCRARIAKNGDGWLIFIEKIKNGDNVFHAIRQNELKYKAISSTSSDGIALVSEQNKLLEFNPAFFQIMNFQSKHKVALSEESLYMRDFFSLFDAELAASLLVAHIDSCRRGGKKYHFEVSGWYGKRYISIVAHALYFDTVSYSGCVLVVRDQTSAKEIANLNKEVEAQRVKSIEASKMAALGEMAGGIAHEINSPLATITMLSGQLQELLAEDQLNLPCLREIGIDIEATTFRIAKIVSGLRLFCRDASSDPFTDAAAKTIVHDTLSFCSEKFTHRGIKLIVDEIPDRLTLECRPSEIAQILLNLLNNACDAVETLTEKWVRISARDVGGEIELSVVDSGGGIPEDVMKRLFQPFFTTKEIGRGTGIGLGISRRIAESHGGTLFVDATCKNTRFVVLLPKAPKAVQTESSK